MTGGLRSGDVQANMYDYNARLQNKALLQSYNQQVQGLEGFASMPDPTQMIYGATVAPGVSYRQGQMEAVEGDLAAAQAE
jgi:hypothetical protein